MGVAQAAHTCHILKVLKKKKIYIYIYIYIFVVVVIFFDCAGSSLLRGLISCCGKWGLLFVAVHRLLTAVASLVAELRFQGA